jgi:hypothetical protein
MLQKKAVPPHKKSLEQYIGAKQTPLLNQRILHRRVVVWSKSEPTALWWSEFVF